MDVPGIENLDLRGRTVLVRSDLNVPLKDGEVADDSRVRATAPTIAEILDRGGRAVVIAHLGRPKSEPDQALSLRPVADALSRALGGREVKFARDCIGSEAEKVVSALSEGECALLENLRFHAGEKENDADFAEALARLGDLYVNDAFSAAHRAHASTVGLAERLPSAAGRLMEAEISALERLLGDPRPPYTAILGGAKVGTKIGVIDALLERANRIMLGGVMANTFLKARGEDVGRSKIAEDKMEAARRLLDHVEAGKIMLPVDAVVAREMSADAERKVVGVSEVPEDAMILDIGPETIRACVDALGQDGTIVWNGPLGAAEHEPFEEGTMQIAAAVAERTRIRRVISVVGGGDTVAFVQKHALRPMFSHVSLAGGAFLHWLSGEPLPGIEALRKAGARARAEPGSGAVKPRGTIG